MSKVNITELTTPGQRWVYAAGDLVRDTETEGVHVRDIVDPLGFPLRNVLNEQGSILFPPDRTDDIQRYVSENGIYVGHVADDDSANVGYVALGHGEQMIRETDKKPLVILETLSYGLKASVASAVVAEVIKMYDVDSDSVHHFTPLKLPSTSLRSLWKKSKVDIIGEVLRIKMPDNTVNKAFGILESLADYQKRIG